MSLTIRNKDTLAPMKRTAPLRALYADGTVADGLTLTVSSADQALADTCRTVIEFGHPVQTYCRGHRELVQSSHEVLNCALRILHARRRLVTRSKRFNIVEACGRLVWMLGGNDRVEDIAFYQDKVRRFSDDGWSVPGSNYGTRLYKPHPNLNQIGGAIKRLREKVGSRRASAVIWTADDAVRESRDIPCAFGVHYAIRGGKLLATTEMRSNNAYVLLPYNIFEFTMQMEMIAASVGAELGTYTHRAFSMHVYEANFAEARNIVAERVIAPTDARAGEMPPMPTDPLPFKQAGLLVQLEGKLRHEFATVPMSDLTARGDELHEYWRAFYFVLLAHAMVKTNRVDIACEVIQKLPAYFRAPMEKRICSQTALTF